MSDEAIGRQSGFHGKAPPGREFEEAELIEVDGIVGPRRPMSLRDTGIDPDNLLDLALKTTGTVPRFTTEWVAQRLCVPMQLATELLDRLRKEELVEITGQAGPFNYNLASTKRGRERAGQIMSLAPYIGPAPVSLEMYVDFLDWQLARMPHIAPQQVADAISHLVLTEEAAQVAGLSVSSQRSLFLYGPAGNGKTHLGSLLHNAMSGHLWIPYCLAIDDQIIRVFDHQVHKRATINGDDITSPKWDQRWICVERPFLAVGGELTLKDLDLEYLPGGGFHEAPFHFKSNGGTFLLDDLGRQQIEPESLLNRWILPLELSIDFLTLQTGQKIEVPFRQMLIFSTNIEPEKVMSPAILRRMGYRLYLGYPARDQYKEIFMRYATKNALDVPEGLLKWLFQRYDEESRPMRGCEPRDLIERVRDICRFREEPARINEGLLGLAWKGYFGETEFMD